ncbi:amidohydrolase family protein [Sinomicrobium weinanense]|uniref:Amidohydrolase family protein n=1 Tax=Sinomicrobium weinanense TaxID=2842200 RepID=A0A926Q368_9FLAO|nr:amidohydrolase family protein [Sinomicrobium weinanense]MBC9795686.1 amidohydrolase family protein [Sinomicrobium weinanense]MBU3122855.1 amidohydrolase family protein [Sinomicrobium weinanense]
MKNTLYILALFVSALTFAQQTPAPEQTESILITGATAHVGNGSVIENSAIGFKAGKITYAGPQSGASASEYDKVIDASGKHVYPGFIAANSTLGLVEVDAVRASNDQADTGELIPHVRSLIAYNAESKVTESCRPNGILMAQVAPRGGLISGTSSVVQLDAWNWEDASIKTDDGIHVHWPNAFQSAGWSFSGPTEFKPNKDYDKDVEKLKNFLSGAKAYLKGKRSPKNLPFEAVEGLFDGSQKLFINADGAKEITDAVNFAKANGIQKVVIIGGNEADKVADLLVKHNIPVLISRPHRLPSGEDTDVKRPYMLAKILNDKGILTGLEMSGAMERMNSRNLPFYAGTCAAYGLDREKAVQLITENNAKILGIDDLAGTLETGKDATLFISEGDALDMRTNTLSHAFIQGREISLESHQTVLWKRYMGKYEAKR